MAYIVLAVLVAFVLMIFVASGIRIVRPWEKGLIERLGKYQRTADSGLTLIVPFIERMIRSTCASRWSTFLRNR